MHGKILIIPDLRTRVEDVETIIDVFEPRKTIFLGDYFDLTLSVEANARTAKWLHRSLLNFNRVHLLGEHDLTCAYPGRFHMPGENPAAGQVVRRLVGELDWARMQFHHWENDFLFSHAGLSLNTLPRGFRGESLPELKDYLAFEESNAWWALLMDKRHWFYSLATGNRPLVDFVNIPDTRQVFGHRAFTAPIRIGPRHSMNLCLSTLYSGFTAPPYLAVLDHNRLNIVSSLAGELESA